MGMYCYFLCNPLLGAEALQWGNKCVSYERKGIFMARSCILCRWELFCSIPEDLIIPEGLTIWCDVLAPAVQYLLLVITAFPPLFFPAEITFLSHL